MIPIFVAHTESKSKLSIDDDNYAIDGFGP